MNRFATSGWPELAAMADGGSVLAVPLGATEQHGPHLPVTTDTDIAVAVAERAAAGQHRIVVAPALCFGASGEHQAFPGTISIGRDAAEQVVVELCRSATVDFAAVVLVSTHGGNAAPVNAAARRLGAEGRRVAVWTPSWGGDLHAGRTETSLMLAIAPDRVALERAAPGDRRPIAELLPELQSLGVRPVSPNGVLGDPGGASAEEGHRLLDGAALDLTGVVDRLHGDAPISGRSRPGSEVGA